MAKILKIALEKVSYNADKLYDYLPSNNKEFKTGQMVLAPFGSSDAMRRGIIIKIENSDDESRNLKSVCFAFDSDPVINSEMIELIQWMKNKYFCTYFDALHLILPPGLGNNIEKIKYKVIKEVDQKDFSIQELNFMELICGLRKSIVNLKEISSLKFPYYSEVLESLISKGALEKCAYTEKSIGCREINIFRICSETPKEKLRSENQKKVFDFLKTNPQSTLNEIVYFTGASKSVIDNLAKKGILICEKSKKYISPELKSFYNPDAQQLKQNRKEINLNEEQSYAYESILREYEKNGFSISLLHGITGSGKTCVIIKLIDYILSENKTAIFMVPEIALTSQFVNLFISRYGSGVAVIHSGLTDWQRFDMWKKIKSGEIKLVVGTRSAVFAPFENIGLIVIDEEHEFTYKSEFSPRYDTREVAAHRCKNSKGMVVLSSATPSIKSYWLAKSGKYNLCEIKSRYGQATLPNIEIIDMNNCDAVFDMNPLSDKLISQIKAETSFGNQVILLVNNRGFNTFAKCANCGALKMCPNCTVSLSYHKANGRLLCHHCGYSAEKTNNCSSCGKEKLVYLGFGTQKIEDILSEKFPNARILRLDSDIKNCNKSFSTQIKDFELGKYDILLGTQMVSKGFNFPSVTLVGVVSVDRSLCDSDFGSFEKAFALITQVVGRAGRMTKPGKAIIQTFNPENEVIETASKQDYISFYNNEILVRKAMLNPPFCDICVLVFGGKYENKVIEAARYVFELLKKIATENYQDIPLRIFSPSEAKIKMISKNYRYKIIIKCKDNAKFRYMINDILEEFFRNKNHRTVKIFPWINPDTIL